MPTRAGWRSHRTSRPAGHADPGILIALEASATADSERARVALEKAVFRLHEPVFLLARDEVVLCAVFSPDGTRVVTTSADGATLAEFDTVMVE